MPYGDVLFQRLQLAKRPDLMDLLGDLKKDPVKFRDASDADLVNAVSAELRSAAGNSIANVRRDPHDFSYKQILIDVADKLAPGRLSWTKFKMSGPETEEQIEDYIYERLQILIEEKLRSMDAADRSKLQMRIEDDLRARGFPEHVVRGSLSAVAAGTLTGVVGGPFLSAVVFGSLWTLLLGITPHLLLSGFLAGGPAGIAVAAAAVTTGASYSKTIPAVTRLIVIRRSREAEAKLGSGQ